MATILIVEDEKGINELIKRTLALSGHNSFQAFTGREAVTIAEKKVIDLVLLDINLPDISGFTLLKQLKGIPVICLTARDQLQDRINGLTKGAEDYIIKPFEMEELLARIQVVLRRYKKEQKMYQFDDVIIDTLHYRVTKGGQIVEVTNQEFSLLQVLLVNKNIALSRSKLLDLAWGMDYEGEERTVDVHIRRLRQKLGFEQVITTVYKYGYRLEID